MRGGISRPVAWRLLGATLLGLASLFVVQAFSSGCSTRRETPTMGADSTRTYPAKDPGGLEASITFSSRSPSKSAGERRGVGDVFTAGENAKVYAFVDLTNQFALGGRPLQFHLVWVGPDDQSFYTKRVEHVPDDSNAVLRSTITIPPGRRDPGKYTLRVYCFRELIAERDFELRHKT